MNNKVIFVELRKKFDNQEVNLSKIDELISKENPKTISLASTIQYLNLVPLIKKYLENKKIKVIIKKGSFYLGQVLGCNSIAFDPKADLRLLLADGKFHALNNALQLEKEIYIFNTNNLEKLTQEEISKEIQRRTAKIKKFLTEDKIGILVSTKKGQNFKDVESLAKKIKAKNKKSYIFEADNFNLQELDNFNLPIYINTACSGLELDNPRIVNLKHIYSYL